MRPSAPLFQLTVLQLALISGFTYAADNTDSTEVQTVHVKGEGVTSTHRVTTKSVEESTATDLKDVLFNEPAVSIGGGNGTSQWFTIRGMGQDQIDVKVDDIYSDAQIFHHNGRFVLDPALVKVIAVQKGTGSASAGIGATSGAIVAETVEARDLLREGQSVGFKVGAGASSNKGWSYGSSVYGENGMFDGLVAGNWVKDRDYKGGRRYHNLEGSDTVLNSALGQRALLVKGGLRFNEDNRIELSHRQEKTYGNRALREEFDFSQAWKTETVRGPNGESITRLVDPLTPNTENNAPRYRILTQDTTNLEYKGGGFGFIDKIKTNIYRMNTKREEPAGDKNPTNQVETIGANLNLDSRLFDRLTLKYGLNWRRQESEPASRIYRPRGGRGGEPKLLNTVNEKKTDVGAYVEGIWDLHPVTLTTGLRHDYYKMRTSSGKEVSGSNLNPSIDVIYDVTDDLSLNTSLAYATRSPRMYEAALAGGRNISYEGDLKAERSRNLELGVKYNLNSALSLTGSVFHQSIKDVQAYTSDAENITWYNGGKLKNKGYELGAAYKWGGLTARAGVAYSKPKLDGQTADTITTAIPMGRTWTTGLAYQFDNPNLEIGWRSRYVQNAGYTQSSRGSNGSVSSSPVRRSGYGVNDIYANWKPTGKDDLNVNFSINNVLDKNYKNHSQRAGTNSLTEPGRDFRLSVNYRF
ncbi:TonB-dependent receptor domain-containing protein [Neisseria wadsworthii]|uniref:Iron-regulated outer membrane protein n=1 Tax=Neisseria wadsworthii 9715 TaxID=1030841 RepID=G4CTC1_9NEIS|nr:TonB-dependent receptor [Neisseria wadsworthii]EGZ44285.1 iron-regulated outer membrane protein [Neisseria wadsworthii 9715]QMT35913.1 TonB-dependent receptor [Neisseria wadsworthii]